MPSLRIKLPGRTTSVYQLYKRITSLGSAAENDIVLANPLIPEVLAHIHFDGQAYSLATLSRKIEVVINGKKRRKHKLRHEDRINTGGIEIQFFVIDAPDATKTSLEPQANLEAIQTLYQFSARLMGKHQLPDLLDSLMDAVIEIASADKGFLVLMEGDDKHITVARNLKGENIADAVSQLSDSIVARVVETKKPLIISDAMNDEEFSSSKSVMQLKLSSVICVPLLDQGTLLGIIYVGKNSVVQLFRQETMQLLTVFSAQAALIVSNALVLNELQITNTRLNEQLDSLRFGEIVGTSNIMLSLFRKVEKVANSTVSVLITGDTGTGKELIARELHYRSSRAKRPFVTVNCGAIPETLLESELFGHVKGAFTGAVVTKDGQFHVAHTGTLFLDEIGEMPVHLQVKLLRVLQEKVVVRVGDTKPQPVDIRILAATNRNLEQEIERNTFREDLYYRLNVVHLHLPPLSEREDDVLVIARFLLQKYASEYDKPVKGFSNQATVAVRKYNWPGNIRELDNKIKRAIILAEGPLIGAEGLGLSDQAMPAVVPLHIAKENFQRQYINDVLARNNGNRTQTAKELGVDPRTVFRHLESGED